MRRRVQSILFVNSQESESGMAKEMLSLMKKQRVGGIVALKGLPSTCKTELAHRIGRWAMCPVLCIQDFLGDGAGFTCALKLAEADLSPPIVPDQVERRHRRAFASLLAAAVRLITYGRFNCVVIKSSLTTPFELHQLLQLSGDAGGFRVIIMECKINNNYLWKRRFESLISDYGFGESRSWIRPKSWKDIDKVVDDADINLLHRLLKGYRQAPYVAWLRIDPFYDLFLHEVNTDPLPDDFNDAIKYLLSAPIQDLPVQTPYVANYYELRQFLFDQKLRDAAQKGRSQSFCEGDCVFKYWERVPPDYEAELCGVCQAAISRKPAYTCHFCVTTLHKTCAERFPIQALQFAIGNYYWNYFKKYTVVQHPCKGCKGGGKEFSKECRFCLIQDRLKCHLVPTIFNHNFHPHFLSIHIHNTYFRCKACGRNNFYHLGCKRCAFYCELECALLPLEVKHEHGGHEHVMKLMYTRDAMEEEEDPCWCDFCYEDMDPESWFYSCQVCPHYVIHLHCSDGYNICLDNPNMVKFVEQLQSQIDDMRARGNSIEPS